MEDNKNIVNESTGEVKKKFVSPFSSLPIPAEDFSVDCSNPYSEIFEEVPPFTIDPDTGKFLNDSSQPKLVSKGLINVQEKIDSFGKETDLYTILEKFAYGDDTALLKARPCEYGDVSQLPDNLNDYAQYINAHYKNLFSLNPELAKKVLDENIKPSDIEAQADSILNERISSMNKEKEIQKKVEE